MPIEVSCLVPLVPGQVYEFCGQELVNDGTCLLINLRSREEADRSQACAPYVIPGASLVRTPSGRHCGYVIVHTPMLGVMTLEYAPRGFDTELPEVPLGAGEQARLEGHPNHRHAA